MSEIHPVEHPLPAGVYDTFTYACNDCGGTISVLSSTRRPHTCAAPAGSESADVRAWDTEYGDYVAWGTHNPTVARTAVRKYILEVIGESPDRLDEMTPTVEDFRNAALYWADPNVIDKEETWDASEFARHEQGFIPYDGWVPYMVVSL
jgi:peptidoglycan/xylan/chitin deacetylase (PgdA/CDA1 family)